MSDAVVCCSMEQNYEVAEYFKCGGAFKRSSGYKLS